MKVKEKSIAMAKWECPGCGNEYGVQKDQLSQHTPEKSCWRCKKEKADKVKATTTTTTTTPEKKG